MIDWFTALIPCKSNPLQSDKIVKIKSSGEIAYEIDCSVSVESSHSDKVTCRCILRDSPLKDRDVHSVRQKKAREVMDSPYMLRIDGNPSKWFQGHNLDGEFNLDLCVDFLVNVCHRLQITDIEVYRRIVLRDFKVTRIDVTFSYELGTVERVREWIRAAGECFHHKHQKAKVYGEQTLMVGMVGDGINKVDTGKLRGSRRSMLKIYCKGDEVKMKDFITRFGPDYGKRLYRAAQGLLRVEVVLRSMYLKDKGLVYFRDFTEEKLMRIYKDRVTSLELPANKELNDNQLDHLSVKLRGVYALWAEGKDLRGMFAKATLSRYAKAMKAFGIDIYAPPRNIRRSNVIPMLRVLEAVPAQLPDGLEHLIYSPNRYTIEMLAA